MGNAVTLQAVGNWSNRIEVPLANALNASVEMLGKTGFKACEQAIAYMAVSASKMTRVSPKTRKVVVNPDYKEATAQNKRRMTKDKSFAKYGYYTFDHNGRRIFHPISTVEYASYLVRFNSATTGEPLIKNMRTGAVHKERGRGLGEKSLAGIRNDKRLIIRNSGIAAQSWTWGLKNTKQKISGVTDVKPFTSENLCGLTLTDRIGYIAKTVPANYAEIVSAKAVNSIMAQVARKFESRFQIEVPRLAARREKTAQRKLDREFKRSVGGAA